MLLQIFTHLTQHFKMQAVFALVSPYLDSFADRVSFALCRKAFLQNYKIENNLSRDQRQALNYLQESKEPKCVINMPAKSGKTAVALLYYQYLKEKREPAQLCIYGKEKQYERSCARLKLPSEIHKNFLCSLTPSITKREKLTFILDASCVNTQHREKQVAQLLQNLALNTKHLRLVILQSEECFLQGGKSFTNYFPLDDTIPHLLRVISIKPGELFSLPGCNDTLKVIKTLSKNKEHDLLSADVFYGQETHINAVLSTAKLFARQPVVFCFAREKQVEGYCFRKHIPFFDIATDETAFYKDLSSMPRRSVENVILIADEKTYTSNFGSYRMYLRARLLLDLLRQRSLEERRMTITVVINECRGESLSFALSLLMPRQLRNQICVRNKSRYLFYNKNQPELVADTRTSFADLFQQVYSHRFYQHKMDRKCRFTLAQNALFYMHGPLLALVQPFLLRQRQGERVGKGILNRPPKKRYVVQESTVSDRDLKINKKRKAEEELPRPEKRPCQGLSLPPQITDEIWVHDYSFSNFLDQEEPSLGLDW